MSTRRAFCLGLAGTACASSARSTLAAGTFPERPLTMVVAFPAGSQTDALARILAERLSQELRQNVIVENRAGANTALGTTFVARSEPNGYTMMLGGMSTLSFNPWLYDNLNYKPTDFSAISMIARFPYALVVRKDLPATTLAEFQAYVRANPDKITSATFGAGSSGHVISEVIADRLGVKLRHVHYRGSGQAATDLMAGHVDCMVETIGSTVPNTQAGLYRALAVSSDQRSVLLPAVPTFRELGYPELTFMAWFALFVPSRTPAGPVSSLVEATGRVMQSAEFQARVRALGNESDLNPDQFGPDFYERDRITWGRQIARYGIKLSD